MGVTTLATTNAHADTVTSDDQATVSQETTVQTPVQKAQAAVDSAQADVDAKQAAVNSAQAEVDSAQAAVDQKSAEVASDATKLSQDQASEKSAASAVSSAEANAKEATSEGIAKASQAASDHKTVVASASAAVKSAQAASDEAQKPVTAAQSAVTSASAAVSAQVKVVDAKQAALDAAKSALNGDSQSAALASASAAVSVDKSAIAVKSAQVSDYSQAADSALSAINWLDEAKNLNSDYDLYGNEISATTAGDAVRSVINTNISTLSEEASNAAGWLADATKEEKEAAAAVNSALQAVQNARQTENKVLNQLAQDYLDKTSKSTNAQVKQDRSKVQEALKALNADLSVYNSAESKYVAENMSLWRWQELPSTTSLTFIDKRQKNDDWSARLSAAKTALDAVTQQRAAKNGSDNLKLDKIIAFLNTLIP